MADYTDLTPEDFAGEDAPIFAPDPTDLLYALGETAWDVLAADPTSYDYGVKEDRLHQVLAVYDDWRQGRELVGAALEWFAMDDAADAEV